MTLQQAVMLALQASILMTVFSFGLRATPGDVLGVLREPVLLGRSLVAMFVIMPIVALALTQRLCPPAIGRDRSRGARHLAHSSAPARAAEKAGGDASFGLGLMVIVGVLSIVIVPLARSTLLGAICREAVSRCRRVPSPGSC